MGFILSIISYILFIFITPFNYIAVLITHIGTHGFIKVNNDHWFSGAFDLDVFANYHFKAFWNLVLRNRKGYLFGKLGETISSALGKNQRDGTLTWVGWIVVCILWGFDYKYWKLGGHCLNSIDKTLK